MRVAAASTSPSIGVVMTTPEIAPARPRGAAAPGLFGAALEVMGDLYASAIGTTTLQLKEIPRRPPELDGTLCLFGIQDGVGEGIPEKEPDPRGTSEGKKASMIAVC